MRRQRISRELQIAPCACRCVATLRPHIKVICRVRRQIHHSGHTVGNRKAHAVSAVEPSLAILHHPLVGHHRAVPFHHSVNRRTVVQSHIRNPAARLVALPQHQAVQIQLRPAGTFLLVGRRDGNHHHRVRLGERILLRVILIQCVIVHSKPVVMHRVYTLEQILRPRAHQHPLVQHRVVARTQHHQRSVVVDKARTVAVEILVHTVQQLRLKAIQRSAAVHQLVQVNRVHQLQQPRQIRWVFGHLFHQRQNLHQIDLSIRHNRRNHLRHQSRIQHLTHHQTGNGREHIAQQERLSNQPRLPLRDTQRVARHLRHRQRHIQRQRHPAVLHRIVNPEHRGVPPLGKGIRVIHRYRDDERHRVSRIIHPHLEIAILQRHNRVGNLRLGNTCRAQSQKKKSCNRKKLFHNITNS